MLNSGEQTALEPEGNAMTTTDVTSAFARPTQSYTGG